MGLTVEAFLEEQQLPVREEISLVVNDHLGARQGKSVMFIKDIY